MNPQSLQYLESNYKVIKGALCVAATKRPTVPGKVIQAMLAANVPLVQVSDIEDWVRKCAAEAPVKGADFRNYSSETEYVMAKLLEYGVTVDEKGIMRMPIREDGFSWCSVGHIIGRMKLDMAEYNRVIPVDESGKPMFPKLQAELIQTALDFYLDTVNQDRLSKVQYALAYKPGVNVRKWCEALLDAYGIDSSPVNVEMLLHMLYLVKRRVYNIIGNERPIFFVFFSRKQGTGKTTLISKLADPFPFAYTGDGVLANLTNANDYKAMVRGKYLVDFQELAISSSIKGDRGEVDPGVIAKIKQAITTGVVSGRNMYAASNSVEAQSAIFSSSSNVHIYDVISDPGGMRRFWEFRLEPKGVVDFALANEILYDVDEVYKAIDENDPFGFYHPGSPYWAEMNKIQESYAKADSFSQFLRAKGWDVSPSQEHGMEPISSTKLRNDFNHWLALRGDREWSMSGLLRLLAQKDIIPQRIKQPNGRVDDMLYVDRNYDWSLK